MLLRSAIILVVVCSPTAALAAADAAGLGTTSCAEFAEHVRVNPTRAEEVYYDWATGFLSGYTEANYDTHKPMRDLAAIPPAEKQRYLRIYCASHPLDDYFTAVKTLYRSLPAYR
jgi:hypothetical protein